jgi:hypothetical protein
MSGHLIASDTVLQCLTRAAFPFETETKTAKASLDEPLVLLVSWQKMFSKLKKERGNKANHVYNFLKTQTKQLKFHTMSFAEAAGWSTTAILASMVARLALASATLAFVGVHCRRGAECWITLAIMSKGILKIFWNIRHDEGSDKANSRRN